MAKLHLITYGCQMNEYDSERVAGLLKRERYELTGINTRSDYVMGVNAMAVGTSTLASGEAAFAEGSQTQATGNFAHAEGRQTAASGFASHAEGIETVASGFGSHAEGDETSAAGDFSHAEGLETRATGLVSHAEGIQTTASGNYSHAEGTGTSTNNFFGAHIMGSYGSAEAPYSWFLANGTGESTKGLAAKILYTGDAFIDHAWNGGGADYAELYETESGQPIEPGYFVTFAGASDKVRIAQASDGYILGIVSAAPGFVAGAGELRWKNKYKTDKWGRILNEDVPVPEVKDKGGMVVVPAHTESRPALNPAYDPQKTYVPRTNRPEWIRVGLLGAIPVRDDGTLTPGGYCQVGVNGVATSAHTGYRVLKRLGTDQVLVLFR
jgi:hypothetical protein